MKTLVARLIYLLFAIMLLGEFASAFQRHIIGDDPREPTKQTTSDPAEGNRKISASSDKTVGIARRKGPYLWRKATSGWNNGEAVSRQSDFVDKNQPLHPKGSFRITEKKPGTYTGTAFAISSNGMWLTAHHVVDKCRNLYLLAGLKRGKPQKFKAMDVYVHPTADAALITTARTDNSRSAFTLGTSDSPPDKVFHVGFPQGHPGAAYGRYLGPKRMRLTSRRNNWQQTHIFAEITRLPDFAGDFGGSSGGVVVDKYGVVAGSLIGGSARRGRFIVTKNSTLLETINQVQLRPDMDTGQTLPIDVLTEKAYPVYAKAAIQDSRVVKVICER
jgi:serine protease Do